MSYHQNNLTAYGQCVKKHLQQSSNQNILAHVVESVCNDSATSYSYSNFLTVVDCCNIATQALQNYEKHARICKLMDFSLPLQRRRIKLTMSAR